MENTSTPLGPQKRGKHIYRTIAAHLQHYCSTFTALLQHISTPAQLQHISAQLQLIPAHLHHYFSTFTTLLQHISTPAQLQHISAQLQHISAHFSLSHHHHITLKARTRVWIS